MIWVSWEGWRRTISSWRWQKNPELTVGPLCPLGPDFPERPCEEQRHQGNWTHTVKAATSEIFTVPPLRAAKSTCSSASTMTSQRAKWCKMFHQLTRVPFSPLEPGNPGNPREPWKTNHHLQISDQRHLWEPVGWVRVLLQPWVLVFQDSQAVQGHPVYPISTQWELKMSWPSSILFIWEM